MSKIEMTESARPTHHMRCNDFIHEAIAIVVNPTMVGGAKRLVCVESSVEALRRFERSLEPLAPLGISNPAAWAVDRVDSLLQICFSDDAWHSALPGGAPVVLIKESALNGQGDVSFALQRVHVGAVTQALVDGEPVPEVVLGDYRQFIAAMSADREVS